MFLTQISNLPPAGGATTEVAMRRFAILLALLLVALAGIAQSAIARNWPTLAGNPLQHPNDHRVISRVIHSFSVLRQNGDNVIADELVRLVIAGHGRPGVVCIGDELGGMSFGESEIWDEPVTVGWTNVDTPCKSALYFEIQRGEWVYGVVRILACHNLAPLIPHQGYIQPLVAGPIYGRVPACVNDACRSC